MVVHSLCYWLHLRRGSYVFSTIVKLEVLVCFTDIPHSGLAVCRPTGSVGVRQVAGSCHPPTAEKPDSLCTGISHWRSYTRFALRPDGKHFIFHRVTTPVDRLMKQVIARQVTYWSNLMCGDFISTFSDIAFNFLYISLSWIILSFWNWTALICETEVEFIWYFFLGNAPWRNCVIRVFLQCIN